MDRIEKFFNELRDEGLSNNEIAAGLSNGEIRVPEWMSISENTDHLKIWDNETEASRESGFIWLDYED